MRKNILTKPGRSFKRGGVLLAGAAAAFAIILSASLIAQTNSDDGGDKSADQIITVLKARPDALAAARTAIAQKRGVDPTVISDQEVYDDIRQDDELRQKASQELEKQGYIAHSSDEDEEPDTSPSLKERPKRTDIPQKGQAPDLETSRPARPGSQPSATRQSGTRMGSSENPDNEPKIKQLPSPYQSLPSLKELYSQIVPSSGKLRRFGSDTFELGTGNANELPMDLPVGPEYVLGPGDNLVVNMWGGQSERLNRTIDRQGQIALSEAGTITVAGLTIAEAQTAIQKILATQFQNEHVEISLGRVRTVRIYVVGDVQRPGAYDVSSLSTPVNALYAAGGPTSRGSLRTLKQFRGAQLVHEIDLYDFLLHGVRTNMERLLPGDTILVPPVGAQVSIAGMVRRPAIYEVQGKEDLKDVLRLAGGVLVSADLKEIRVERVEAHERRTTLNVRIPDGAEGEAALPAFHVQDGDSIQVAPIRPYNEQVVYLDGHVFKPGPYAWRDGMTVNDLLRSYQDVMPEPASHAEIIRLQPPDFRPNTISFELPDLLIGDDPITLQPFDVIRIFGRYEIDPPKVSIYGEVVRPGEYPMSEGMTASGLVRMAGGFRRSAFEDEADLSSYQVQNGKEVLVSHRVVAIQRALSGEKDADVVLKPGDVVGIRQLTGWTDIGAAITISGEVAHAGTYGIEPGERLSSVLKRAGGFREDAYPAGAVLERVQVRQLEEANRQEMIRRVESTVPNVAPGISTSAQDQQSLLQSMRQQQQDVLNALRNHPSSGRLVIKISSDIGHWENTPADILVRAGDNLTVPKRPDFVLVSGQVYNATGISYHPGKNAEWYLHQAGGATRSGDRRATFVLRADGTVVGGASTLFGSGVLGLSMHPGDSVIVPEKVVGGSMLWRNLMGTAQILSSIAITGSVAGVF